MGMSRWMTSTIWTFGGGAAAADTFLFPHPLNNRRVQIPQPKTHSVAAKVQELAESLLSLVPPTCVKNLTPELEACHWLGMASPSRWWVFCSMRAQADGETPNQTPH